MKRSHTGFVLSASCCMLLGVLAMATPPPAHAGGEATGPTAASGRRDESPQRATWVRRHINLVFIGSGTYYSCYYLSDYVRHILLQLGARRTGMAVHPVACGRGNPSVAGSFYALEPARDGAAAGSSSPTGTVAAHWASVAVSDNAPFEDVLDVTDKCELVRTVFDSVLPLFAARDAHLAPGCITYNHLTSSAMLHAQVLKADARR